MTINLPEHPPEFAFDPAVAPVVRVESGSSVRFRTEDAFYREIDGRAIDAGRVDFQRANALAGPVYLEGARPGDAIGLRIDEITIDQWTFAVYVRRWREAMFGVDSSRVLEVAVDAEGIRLPGGRTIRVEPMIGCIGIAPASGRVSSLGPTGPTGGNMDLVEMRSGTTVWFPVQVEGGLLSLGDLHARMGRGEPLGSGLECGGTVVGTFLHASEMGTRGPVVCDGRTLSFVGGSAESWRDAERNAARAAWEWLTIHGGVPEDHAIVLCAAVLDVNAGGPAGNNVIASLSIGELAKAGVRTDVWPVSQAGAF